MKKLFVTAIIIMCCATAVILGAGSAFCAIEDAGYAVPADAGIAKLLAEEGGEPVSLVEVQYDDIIYSSLSGYYVGSKRDKVDITYPLYTNGGNGLRFLGDENWLVTTDVDLYQTFDGLYVREGLSYNADMTQADDGEFIMLALSNGLYMNAQQAVFHNAMGDTVIPMGSILSMSEDAIRWFEQKNGTLGCCCEEAVFGATISFGSHTYEYLDLLDALGLIREAIKDADHGQPDPEKLQEAEEVLNGKGDSGAKKPGTSDNSVHDKPDSADGDGTSEFGGEDDNGYNGGETSDNTHNGSSETGDKPNEGNNPSGGGTSGSSGTSGSEDISGGGSSGSGGISGGGSSGSGGISGGGSSGSGSTSGGGSSGSGGISGGGSSGGSGISGSGSGSGGSGENQGETGEAEPGEGESGGESQPIPYQKPAVTLNNIQPWSYALGLDLKIDDPSGAILRGVSFSVYKSIKGSGGTETNDMGFTVYPSSRYEGKSAMLRKNKTGGSQSFALSPLQPGQKVYLQYNFRYNAEETDETTGVKRIVRKYYYSDLIEITIPTVEQGDVKTVSADWTVDFAASSNALKLNNLTLANTSGYDPTAETYRFENFKLNTLPYVNRLELRLTPEGGGTPVTIVAGSSTLSRAQQEGGTSFVSSSPKLDSNKRYTCEVTAKDRYGNVLPLDAADSQAQAIYTRKETPVVTITEKENVTDSLTLGIHVSDPDGALKPGQPLRFQVKESRTGTAAELYGTWDTSKISAGGSDIYELELKNPADGCDYELKLDSLAFSCLYLAEVYGDYSPQPDNVAEGEGMVLESVTDEMLGTLTVYTAPLTSGLVAFNTGVTDLMDTSVTMNATMTSDTTLDILPLIDEFRITLKEKSGSVVNTTVLSQDVLAEGSDYTYDTEKAAVVLQPGDHMNPQVMLYGTRDKYLSDPWYSFLIHEAVPEPESSLTGGYTKPMQLKISMPAGSLNHFTEYSFSIQAVVKKSGQEYLIPVSMTNNKFTTKKTLPVVQYKDLFLAADVAEFLDLKIYDPDGTILNDGAVTVQLYYGNTLLKAEQITADRTGNAEGIDLRFDGLIEGGEYTLKFVAAAYNDAEGYGSYQTNYVLETFNLVGGSALYGKLNLLNLGKNGGGTGENLVDFNHYYEGYMRSSGYFPVNGENYRSYYIQCEPNTDYYISAPSFASVLRVAWTAGNLPETQTTSQIRLSGVREISSVNKSMVYHTGDNARYMVVDLGNLSYSSPEVREKELTVRKYDASLVNGDFAARINVTAMDKVGYLGREGETAEVTLTIERSDSMEIPEYSVYGEKIRLPLTRNSDGTLSLDIVKELTGLSAGDGWRATLMTTYQGSQVMLDQITFRTDVNYITVSNHAQLQSALRANSSANILVISDFVQDQDRTLSLSGTIDFQGHVVTKGDDITTFFFNTSPGSQIRNLVYDYPNKPYYVNPSAMFYVMNGTLENLIVRTYGQVEATTGSKGLIALSIGTSGTLRNFIVRAGGDLIGNTSGDSIGLISTQVHGIMENGYIYGVNGAGMIARGYGGSVGLFGYSYQNGGVQNVYVLMDSWYQTGTSAALLSRSEISKKTLSNIYTVGDFYTVGAAEGKNYLLPLTTLQAVNNNSKASGVQNVWCLTSREYANKSVVHTGEIARLYDKEWQNSILGSAFDVDGCVSMGFYPRLYLPTEMQKYQEYIPLPVMGQDAAPKLVGDCWADEAPYDSHNLDSGYIKLRFRNSGNMKIDGVSIKGLITEVMDQKAAADGLYDVILNVQVNPAAPEYVSTYQVTDFTYTSGTVKRSVNTDYQTSGIDFWKAVATPVDWANINEQMSWNYKLTQDIDLSKSGLTYGEIIINGSKVSYSAVGEFKGRLDGQEHVVKGIHLENISYPHVIYKITGGELKNLLVEGLYIESSKGQNTTTSGFIGAQENSLIQNVHIRNSTLFGGRYMGMLVGVSTRGIVEQCSVTDSVVTDAGVDAALYAGGMFGQTSHTHVKECYTRDLSMCITQTNVVNGVGGLIGYAASNTTESCYTHGYIEASGNYVGGITGWISTGDGTTMRKCWSYVDILQRSGDYAAGTSAFGDAINFTIALGNVAGSGPHTDRVVARIFSTNFGSKVYAYKGQIVGAMTEDEKGNAKGLLSGEELGRADTWQDTIRLGDKWDYSAVNRGSVPLLKADCSREGWQQQDIPLPGQAIDPVLRVEEAKYINGKYYLMARLTHPEISSDFIEQNVKIKLDGMDLSDDAVANGRTIIGLHPVDGKDETLLQIITSEFTKALDTYALNLQYTEPSGRERALTIMVQYQDVDGTVHENWWEVKNLVEWESVVASHGKSGENVMITGMIDFGNGNTKFRELEFNRLQGREENSGFYNLSYKGGANGQPWITKVGVSMGNLCFENLKFDFTQTETSRGMTGAIFAVSDADKLKLNKIRMMCNRNSRGSFGFISLASGTVSNVEMTKITVEDAEKSGGSNVNYCGALIADFSGAIQYVTAKEITMDVPKTQYVGGILGRTQNFGQTFDYCSIEDFNIAGLNYVGGLIGSGMAEKGIDSTAIDGTVKGGSCIGGLFGYHHYCNSATAATGWLVRNVNVIGTTGYAGGLAGQGGHFGCNGARVENCNIEGKVAVGGAVGNCSYGHKRVYNLQVIGCTIKNNTTTFSATSPASNCAGGLYGNYTTSENMYLYGGVVRDCTITGSGYVGGFAGTFLRTLNGPVTQKVYVAEDVTVTASESGAGGLVGYANWLDLTDCASGATVTAGKNVAGGIIGHLEPQNNAIMGKLEKIYYKGSVSAGADYAGGIIGKLNSGAVKTTDENMKQLLVAADVRTGGENASLWINDIAQVGDAGTGTMYICEDSVLNGQTAKSLVEMAEVSGQTQYVIPKRTDNIQLMIPASDFAAEAFYKTTLGFAADKWDFSGLDTYMPYTKDYAGTSVLQYVNNNYAGKADGILVPDGGALGLETVVYASGVNTVNIETAVPEGTISVNDKPYTTDANGVVTLYYDYDYNTGLSVGGTTYSGASLSRKVMTYGDYWYYIDGDGNVHYGKATGTAEEMQEADEVVTGITNAVHLWQGYAMDESGNIYELNGGTANATDSVETGSNLAKLENARAFWQDGSTQVYYYFTMYQGNRIPYRVFLLDGTAYTVSPSQNTVYDGVVLSAKTEFGVTSRYFALLDKPSGSLKAYLSNMKLGDITNSEIQYISNNMGYNGTVMLAYYEGGNVVGVDYTTGKTVCDTFPPVQSFALYARRTIMNLGLLGGSNILTSDGSYSDGETLRDTLTENGQYESDGTAPITDSGNGEGGNVITGGTTAGETGQSGSSFEAGTNTQSGSNAQNGSNALNGSSTVSGSNTGGGSQLADGDSMANGSEGAPDGIVPEDSTASGGADNAVDESHTSQSGGGRTDGTKGAEKGNPERPLKDGSMTSSSGTGTEGSIASGSVGSSNPVSEHKNNGKEGSVSVLTTEEALTELFGTSMIAYSDKTGKYELLDTASMAAGQQVELVDALAQKNDGYMAVNEDSENMNADTEKKGENHFSVAWGLNRNLYADEKQGFLLIALAAAAAVAVLFILYWKVIRRRKNS